MKRCQCGQLISLFSLYPVCEACLHEYLAELPYRRDFSIKQFQSERQQISQSVAALTHVSAVPQRVRLLDVAIDPVTHDEVRALLESYVESGLPHQIVTVNVDFIRIAQEHERFRRIINNAALSVADGKPLLWAARWTGQELPARITGTDLVLSSAELALQRDESLFFLGAAEGVAAKAAAVLMDRYPGLTVHFYAPPMGLFSEEENARMVQAIRDSGATYLFVAFGAPKQDLWINEHLQALGVPVCAGVGGVFNFLAGVVNRAPAWIQRCGMEWLYRIAQEPTRLWRRYFVEDMPIFARMLTEPVTTNAGNLAQPAYRLMTATMAPNAYDRGVPVAELERAVGGS